MIQSPAQPRRIRTPADYFDRTPLTDEQRAELIDARRIVRIDLGMAGDRRGSGRTTRQLTDAPRGSLIVAASSGHARDILCPIASRLERADLIIASWGNLRHFQGLTLGGIVIEHFAAEQWLALSMEGMKGARDALTLWRALEWTRAQVRAR